MNPYETNLDKNQANYVPLTPLSFVERAKDIYEDKIQTANFFFNRVLPRIESSYITATTGSNYIMNYKFN